MQPTEGTRVSVVSYNILSSALTKGHTRCNPDHLENNKRFKLVLSKLMPHMSSNSILLLQEISQDWTGPLTAHLANNGYQLMVSQYGSKFDNYMGVGIAYPWGVFDLVDAQIRKPSQERPWPRGIPPRNIVSKFYSWILNLFQMIRGWFGWKEPVDPYAISQYKWNSIVMQKLREKNSGVEFCVGTYHNPCMFRLPAVMTIHSALAMQTLAKFAKNSPFILGGDFNITPSHGAYSLYNTGDLSPSHPDHPPPEKITSSWKVALNQPMKSAYKEVNGQEPEFTNLAYLEMQGVAPGEGNSFKGTLDYLWFSTQGDLITPLEVVPIPSVEELGSEVLPCKTEPSDHVLIGASFEIRSPSS